MTEQKSLPSRGIAYPKFKNIERRTTTRRDESRNALKAKSILLLGTHGQENWGDEILLETFLQSLGAENKFFVNSYNPDQTKLRFGRNIQVIHQEKNGEIDLGEVKSELNNSADQAFDIDVFHTTKDVLKLPFKIWKSDIVFFAGGSILKELYASYGRWAYSTLFMILGIVSFTKIIARKDIVVSNIGVGPVKTKLGKFLVKLILSQVDIISLRDEASKQIVLDSGISEEKVIVVPDIVFIRTSESFGIEGQTSQEEKRIEEAKLNSNKPKLRVGLNLNKDIAKPEMWPSLLENVEESLYTMMEQNGAKFDIEIIGIPMQIGFSSHHDLLILQEFSQKNPNLRIKIETAKTSSELAKTINSCNFIVAERLHAIIIATVLNVPSVPLIYDPKVASLAKYLALEKFAVDVNKAFKPEELNQKISLLIEQLDQTKTELSGKYSELNKIDKEYFTSLKSRLNLI